MRGPRFRRRPHVLVARTRIAGTAKAAKPRQPFDPAVAWATAQAILAAPPGRPHMVRAEPVGTLVARWLLPLDCAPTENAKLKMSRNNPWAYDSAKRKTRKLMLQQCNGRRAFAPLHGRPHVLVIIFSHNVQDYDQGRTKFVLDRLQPGEKRRPKKMHPLVWEKVKDQMPPTELNFIAGDRRDQIRLDTWTEVCAPGKGCVLVELYTGEVI